MLPDGRADMCDSCPDITIYNGKFVNSCRMDEYRLFGGFLSVVEKTEPAGSARMSAAQLPGMTIGQFLRSLWRILAGRPNIPPALQGNALLQTVLKRRSVRQFTRQGSRRTSSPPSWRRPRGAFHGQPAELVVRRFYAGKLAGDL